MGTIGKVLLGLLGLVVVLGLIGNMGSQETSTTSQNNQPQTRKSAEKEDWMKDSDQKESTVEADGSEIYDIHGDATLIRERETNLPSQIKIKNISPATWEDIKVTINSGLFGGGYTYSYPIVGPHTEITIGVRKFTKGNGERFNPYATKIKELKLVAHVNGSRDFQIFKG